MKGALRYLLPAWAVVVAGQFSNWPPEQINTTICVWYQTRATIVRDIIYLDGGNIWWSPGLDDGRYGTPKNDGNFGGKILTYNLSQPFDADTNTTGILLDKPLSKARGGEGSSNGAAPNYFDGALLSNDAEFFLYGGALFRNTQLYDSPDDDEVLGYQAYEYGPDKPSWEPGFDDATLGDEVTRNIAYGAAVNAPSENKAWYFSGMTAPNRTEISFNFFPNGSDQAQEMSDTLIQVDMETQFSEVWTNKTLHPDVKPRANAEVVWVPVGEQGILVVLGGVTYPEWETYEHLSTNQDQSEEDSPTFMKEIDIYDIANDEWYKQPTENGPDTRTRGCAVLATASDQTSFNIYYYGGYNGINIKDEFHDDVWVLSLPSFTWTLLNEGEGIHARAGHKCFAPYPDQMMVFGGYTPLPGSVMGCLAGGPVVIFNMSSGEWMDSYHPEVHSDYGVPDKVVEAIGGDASGGATLTTPAPSGWATDALGDVFSSSYDMGKISTWYPYPVAETDPPRPDLPDSDSGSGSGLPSWVAPVLGVVLGLMVVTGAIVVFCLWRRRKFLRSRSSDAGTEDAGLRIMSWIKGQPSEKATTITASEVAPRSPEMAHERYRSLDGAITPSSPRDIHPGMQEMQGTPIAELDASTPPAELHDTGLSPIDIINKHTQVGRVNQSVSTNSQDNFSFATSYMSFTKPSADADSSRESEGQAHTPALTEVNNNTTQVDPPTVPRQNEEPMQSLSETIAGAVERDQRQSTRRIPSETVSTPVSPPTTEEVHADDYITARAGMVSPLGKVQNADEDLDAGNKQ